METSERSRNPLQDCHRNTEGRNEEHCNCMVWRLRRCSSSARNRSSSACSSVRIPVWLTSSSLSSLTTSNQCLSLRFVETHANESLYSFVSVYRRHVPARIMLLCFHLHVQFTTRYGLNQSFRLINLKACTLLVRELAIPIQM